MLAYAFPMAETEASNETTANLELALLMLLPLFGFCLIPFIVQSAAVDYECYGFFFQLFSHSLLDFFLLFGRAGLLLFWSLVVFG